MKRSKAVAAAITVIAILFTTNSFAQMGQGYKWRGSGGAHTYVSRTCQAAQQHHPDDSRNS